MQGVLMKLEYARRLVGDIQRFPARWILRGNARGAAIGMAVLRLDATQREHETSRGVAPVGTKRKGPRDVERAGDLARGANADFVAKIQAHQCVVHQHQRFMHRHTDMLDELRWSGPRATFRPVDHDEIREDSGFLHGLGHAKPFPRMADRQLETDWLAAGEFAQPRNEFKESNRRRELGMP